MWPTCQGHKSSASDQACCGLPFSSPARTDGCRYRTVPRGRSTGAGRSIRTGGTPMSLDANKAEMRKPMPATGVPGPRPDALRPPTSLVRVLLCEDQEVFRLGLRVILEAQP